MSDSKNLRGAALAFATGMLSTPDACTDVMTPRLSTSRSTLHSTLRTYRSRLITALATLATVAGLMAGSAIAAPVEAQDTGRDRGEGEIDAPEVLSFRIRGNKAVSRGELEQSLVTKQSGCLSLLVRPFCLITKSKYVYRRRFLDRTEFQRDVIRALVVYFKRGYRDARVDTVITRVRGQGVRITLNVTEGPVTRVTALNVQQTGEVLTERDLQRDLRPKVGDALNLLALDSSVIRLRGVLFERGYANGVLAPVPVVDDSGNSADVTLGVDPKRKVTIGTINIIGNRAVTEQTIRNSLLIEPGDLFRLSEIGRSQRALYESGLFRRAVIDTVTRLDTIGQTRRTIVNGRLTDVPTGAAAENVGRTAANLQDTLLAARRPGGRDSIIIAITRDSLRRDSTRRALAVLARGTADTVKTLVVRVQEAPLREARLRAGFTTADFVQTDALFTHNYLFGGPRRFDASLTIGNLLAQQLTKSKAFVDISNLVPGDDLGRYYAPTYQASVDVRQRWFQSPRNTVGAGLFTHRRSSPGVFVDRGYGASATFTRELAERTPLSATYRFEIARVEAGDVYFCVNYGVCDNTTINALRGQQKLSPVAFTFSIDRTDAPFSPTRGILGRAELEHASAFTASDFRYNRAYLDVATYRALPFRRTVAAAHLRAGWVNPLASTAKAVGGLTGDDIAGAPEDILHPRKRFYAGGAQSVRGFGENQLGPRVLTIDPDKLRGRSVVNGVTSYRCDLATPIASCAVNDTTLRDSDFQPRPLGGTTLLEAGFELRIPIWRALVGAVFVDGAILGEGTLGSITKGTGAITPGFGVRYESPVGPVRVDLGIRPSLRERLPVVTQTTDSLGRRVLVDLSPPQGCSDGAAAGCRLFPDPKEKRSFVNSLTNRLTLHLSIGQAF